MPQYFKFDRSHIFATLLLAGYCLAIIIIILLPLAVMIKYLFTALLTCTMFYYLWRYAWLLSPSSEVAMRMEGVDVFLIFLDGREIQVKIATETLVTPFLTILSMDSCATGNKYNVVIFPDSLDSERYRELRVVVKWRGFASSDK